jgi:methyl-accepting chemotaxis protein
MNRLSIGARIYLTVGIVLALLAAISSISYFATSELAEVFNNYRSTARQTLIANEQIEDLFEARLSAFGYRVQPSDDRAALVSEKIGEIHEASKTARELFANEPAVLRTLAEIEGLADRYKDGFEQMTALQAERETIVSELASIGPKARKQLTSIMTSAFRDGDGEAAYYAGIAQQELMLGRFYAERFLLKNDDASFDRSNQHLVSAKKQLNTLLKALENPDRRQNATQTVADLDTYVTAAGKIKSIIKARNDIRAGTLDVIGPQVQGMYDEILNDVVTRQNTLGPQGSATAEQTLTLVGMLSLIALLVGAIAAFVIARWTSRSVQETVNTMTELANGKLDIDVKGAEFNHELGEMAKALHVFKDNAKATNRMQEEKASQAKAEAEAAAEQRKRDHELGAEIVALVEKVTSGDLSNRLSTIGREGILAEVCNQINQLVDGLQAVLQDVSGKIEALASGNLSQRVTADYQGAFGELKNNVNKTAQQLAEIVTEIKMASREVENAAAEISSGTGDLSERTEQAATNLEETAASTEQMSATVKQNAESAMNASRLAETANQTASKGGEVVEQVVGAMSGIEGAAQKITDIISVIDEIAFQTNLLALNASVEAARAGEAGKGFAVVAQEVRQLAQRSAQAASDIKTLIQDSNNQVKDGVQLVNQAGEALGEIVGSIDKVTGIVREISGASQEQASGVQEINSSITSMDEMTQQNSALVEESTAAARALSEQASKLGELIAFFKLDGAAMPVRRQSPSKPQSATSQPARLAPKAKQVTKSPSAVAVADDDGWSEF